MPLLRKVYAIIGQRDVPLSGVGKTNTHSFRKGLTELDKGAGVINDFRTGHPRSQSNWRRRDQQALASVQRDA